MTDGRSKQHSGSIKTDTQAKSFFFQLKYAGSFIGHGIFQRCHVSYNIQTVGQNTKLVKKTPLGWTKIGIMMKEFSFYVCRGGGGGG